MPVAILGRLIVQVTRRAIKLGTVQNPQALGLDVVFPGFFLVPPAEELRDRRAATVAVVAGWSRWPWCRSRRRASRWWRRAGGAARPVEAPVTAVWLTIVLVAVASATIKVAGPLLLGDRSSAGAPPCSSPR